MPPSNKHRTQSMKNLKSNKYGIEISLCVLVPEVGKKEVTINNYMFVIIIKRRVI